MPDLLVSDDRCPPGWCRIEEIVRLRAALAEAERERDRGCVSNFYASPLALEDLARYHARTSCAEDALAEAEAALAEAERQRDLLERRQEDTQSVLVQTGRLLAKAEADLEAVREREGRLVMKPTPGPWEWWTSNSWRRLRHSDRGVSTDVIMPCVHADGTPDICVSEDDARLIAAAPTMFEYIRDRADEGDDAAKRLLEQI